MVFTGLVKGKGLVGDIKKLGNGMNISITVSNFPHIEVGDSIMTNGVCLTATSINDHGFIVHAMYETLDRTNLRELKKGDLVNLEPALTLSDRLDGHIVTGHIDGTGKITERTRRDTSEDFWIRASSEIMSFVVEKGSIAIDGISLTVTKVKENGFGVSIIPHTLDNTNLSNKDRGDIVNLETDIIGKYVMKLLANKGANKDGKDSIDQNFLARHGFST